ncbi:LysR substrate-binding domain-containing protein [Cupriavidus sp.]|uniref:LysR substrate-binding domain-containing protein n=1 Tax=Cupriavidus sp. TaxID=1873897 RepID=UPI003D12617F
MLIGQATLPHLLELAPGLSISTGAWNVPICPADKRRFTLPDARFRVNVPDAMAVALQEGMGIGALPTLTVRAAFRAGTLVHVLPEYHLQRLDIYVLYASRQYLDTKIKTRIAFIREWIPDALRADEILVQGVDRPV